MIWTLSKLGLTSGLRRVSDEKILLAEMREARRQADRRLKVLEEPQNAHHLTEKATEMLQNFSNRLSESYTELEQAMSDKVDISRQAMQQWRSETRELVRHVASMKSVKSNA